MNYGLYTAFLGMRSRQRTLDVQANNLANASTAGFKAESLLYSAIESAANANQTGSSSQKLAASVSVSGATNFTGGTIRETGRSLDVALEGDGFFAVQTPAGTRYTRAGNFTLDAGGQLVTHDGSLVVGERGAITVPPGGEISIGDDGTISAGGQIIDKLKIVRFNSPANALIKEGTTNFLETGTEKAQAIADASGGAGGGVRVVQGALEMSNVNSMQEMVAMIQNNREFESLQKSISTMMNDLGRKISSEIGRM